MEGLAEFEDYIDEFCVTEKDLIERGLCDQPEFFAFVAEVPDGTLVGMAVYYIIPYTYDLCPDMVLKELFVAPDMRGTGVGQALMGSLRQAAEAHGCNRIKWLVLSDNESAKRFYAGLGANRDRKWENWNLLLDAGVTRESTTGERVQT
jgi:GNAT superfamily N-acetyltransferase